MKLYEALFNSLDEIKTVLNLADLVEGISLSDEEIKNTKKILYWYIEARGSEAARKQTYLTYSSLSFSPQNYGDGIPQSYKVTYGITIFTNKENIKDLIVKLDNCFTQKGWNFDLSSSIDYNQQNKVFTYPLTVSKVI